MSRNLFHILTVVFFSCLICQQLKAQVDFPADLNPEALQAEDILLTTDRNLYVTGEDIYFSVFISGIGSGSKQSSKVLYVELFNYENTAVVRQKLPVEHETAEGIIRVKGDIRTGRYYLRAFTQYSRNFLPEAYAVEHIDIINPDLPAQIATENIEVIMIYPEYGSLYAGVENNVAFKISQPQKDEVDSIVLYKDSLNISAESSLYFDAPYGHLLLLPEENSMYYMKAYFSSGDSSSVKFNAKPIEELFISHNDKKDKITLKAYGSSSATERIQLDIYNSSGSHIGGISNLFQNNSRTEINKNKLQPGINYLVVRGKDLDTVSTIAVFKDFPAPIEVELQLNATEFHPREAVIVKTDLSEGIEEPALVNISVVKEGTAGVPDEISGFLMENIHLVTPFDLNAGTKKQQLQTAMLIYNSKLSRGAKTINFNRQNNDKLWLPDLRDISISGYLRDKKTGKPIADEPVVSSLLFDNPQIHISRTNDEGVFLFSFYELYGNREIFISTLDNEDHHEILINNEFAIEYPRIDESYTPPDSSISTFLDELFLNAQLNNIYFPSNSEETKPAPDIFGDNLTFIYPDEYIDLPSLQDIFNEIIPYARVRTDKDEVRFGTFNTRTNLWSDNPLIMLDNAPVSDPARLLEIHPENILKVGILTRTYLTGDRFLPGLILIYTKSGQFGSVEFPDNAVFLEYQTYSQSGNFSAPEYNEPSRNSTTPDFRNTLFWEPSVQIKDDKEFIFYTSDHISDYQVLLKGKTKDGRPVIGKASFKVTRQPDS